MNKQRFIPAIELVEIGIVDDIKIHLIRNNAVSSEKNNLRLLVEYVEALRAIHATKLQQQRAC